MLGGVAMCWARSTFSPACVAHGLAGLDHTMGLVGGAPVGPNCTCGFAPQEEKERTPQEPRPRRRREGCCRRRKRSHGPLQYLQRQRRKTLPAAKQVRWCTLTSSPFNSTPTCPTCSLSSHLPQQLLSHAAQLLLLPRAGRDLTQYAAAGKLDPVVGRTAEMERLIQILVRRTKNNPCLLGDPGVGKTAIVEGLAQMIACEESTVPELLRQKRVRLS